MILDKSSTKCDLPFRQEGHFRNFSRKSPKLRAITEPQENPQIRTRELRCFSLLQTQYRNYKAAKKAKTIEPTLQQKEKKNDNEQQLDQIQHISSSDLAQLIEDPGRQ